MSHDHHTSHAAPGFGKNTNGLGIFIVAIIFVVLALFTWSLWNNNDMEAKHYRLEKTEATAKGEDHSGH
ncbi:MAG TPA: hypothetical protein VK907_13475 [Phnomibacter sp.]|nr:hypothetical protein [Phnomibacter sp.]